MSFSGGNSAFGNPATTAFTSFGNANPGAGAQTQPTQPTNPVFGSFGGANQSQTQGQGQTQPQQQQQQQVATGSSFFPSANAGTNPLFGGKPASSLFGNTTTSTTQTQPAVGTGGSSQTVGGSSTFGTAGTFGVPTASTGLLGASTNIPNQQNQQPTLSTGAPSTFGQQQTQQQQPTTSLFGQFTAQPQSQQTGLFGNLGQSTATSLFGLPNAGASTSSIFAPKISLVQMQNQGDSAQAQFVSLVQRIESVAQAWNSSSLQCRFQHFFYNLVDPSQVHMYGRPQNAINDALWQKAVRENPDPSCYVPALAVGFDDLQKRVEAQKTQTTAHQEKLKELKTRIAALSSSHSTTNAPRLHRAAAVQTQLLQRLVRLVQHLHLLIPSVRSSSIRPEEEVLRSVLESLEEEVKRPGGVGRLKGKLSELWAAIGAIEAAREQERKNGESNIEWAVVDAEGMQSLTQILAEQQNGIAHLTKIVQSHQKDLNVILGKAPQEREADAFSNPQASQVLFGASMRQ